MHLPGLLQYQAQLAGSAFVTGLWQGALLAAAVWLCLRLAPRATATLRFAVWAVVLMTVCMLPFLGNAAKRPHGSLLTIDLRCSLVVAALWLTASLLRAVSLAWHGYTLWALHRQATPVFQTGNLQTLLASHRRRVQVCTSRQVDRPGVIGFFAPRILIPAWLYPQLTSSELEQIVLHEIEHLRRRDDWLNLLQKLALVLFPLNPILIVIERLLCRERELACDDGVLRRTHSPGLYATCLATLAERGLDHRAFSLALGTLGDANRNLEPCRSEVGRRIGRILRRQTAASPLQTRVLTAAVGLVVIGGATGLTRCPQLVAFVPAMPATVASVSTVAGPARTVRVVRAEDREAGPHLVNASFPVGHRPRVHRRKPSAGPQAQLQNQLTPPDTAFRLIGWPEQERPRFLTLGADLPASGHFAVVSVEGGWLLVQL